MAQLAGEIAGLIGADRARAERAATLAKADLEQRLCGPLPAAELADAGRQLKTASAELDTLEGEWLALSEQLEHTLSA